LSSFLERQRQAEDQRQLRPADKNGPGSPRARGPRRDRPSENLRARHVSGRGHKQARMKVSLTPDGCGIDGILMRVAAIALHDDQIRRNAISLRSSEAKLESVGEACSHGKLPPVIIIFPAFPARHKSAACITRSPAPPRWRCGRARPPLKTMTTSFGEIVSMGNDGFCSSSISISRPAKAGVEASQRRTMARPIVTLRTPVRAANDRANAVMHRRRVRPRG